MVRRKVYTKAGDDGTTGLFYGGRVAKDSELPTAYGSVDEAQAVLGLARAHAVGELDRMLVAVMQDLWVLMAELATLPENRSKLDAGTTAVTQEMVDRLEQHIDALDEQFDPPTEFVVPGGNVTAAWLDLARTVVRRAERHSLAAAPTAVARRALPQPAVRPAVDDGPVAGGRRRLDVAGARRRRCAGDGQTGGADVSA